ncbi:MAG: GNAT family N-acetyltransferase [Bacteroidota bacterium]
MKIIEVNSEKDKKAFFDTARSIYKNDKNWTCPLDIELDAIFDPVENTCFRNGEAIRWVLMDAKNNPIGRIAAFIDYNKVNTHEQPSGGVGFFECIDDQSTANLLFDTAKVWLQERKMEAMDGPINFGENYMNWGLLVEGFMHQGYGMQYHHAYYKKLFENYGFKLYFSQLSYHLDPKDFPIERFSKITEWSEKRGGFSYKQFEYTDIDKFVDDFIIIFSRVWQSFKKDYAPVDRKDILKMFNSAKPIIDKRLIWFAYHNDKPIAMIAMFPDVNQILKKMNGKLHFINKLKFAWLKWRKTMKRARVILIGVVPEFQKSGLEAGMITKLSHVFLSGEYTELEISWVGDFNNKMRKMAESINSKHVKTHATYRFMFDRNKEFKRYPMGV